MPAAFLHSDAPYYRPSAMGNVQFTKLDVAMKLTKSIFEQFHHLKRPSLAFRLYQAVLYFGQHFLSVAVHLLVMEIAIIDDTVLPTMQYVFGTS